MLPINKYGSIIWSQDRIISSNMLEKKLHDLSRCALEPVTMIHRIITSFEKRQKHWNYILFMKEEEERRLYHQLLF